MATSSASIADALSNEGPWQLAVFDLDGTLVDTRQDLMEALADTLEPDSLDDAKRERAEAALPMGMHAMLVAALDESVAQDERVVRRIYERYLSTYGARIARHSRPYAEVPETLSWLRARGVQMALCSNKPKQLSRVLLRMLDLFTFFPVIVGPECTGKAKPHPEPLRHAAWLSNIARSRSVLIGDSRIDAECAERAGMPSWIFMGGYDPAARSRASMVFDHFNQIREPGRWADNHPHSRRSVP
jgi:phosphoglycolate phosphatase